MEPIQVCFACLKCVFVAYSPSVCSLLCLKNQLHKLTPGEYSLVRLLAQSSIAAGANSKMYGSQMCQGVVNSKVKDLPNAFPFNFLVHCCFSVGSVGGERRGWARRTHSCYSVSLVPGPQIVRCARDLNWTPYLPHSTLPVMAPKIDKKWNFCPTIAHVHN